jgi:hypothetical protein
VENYAGIDVGKKFLAVCVLTAGDYAPPLGAVRRAYRNRFPIEGSSKDLGFRFVKETT